MRSCLELIVFVSEREEANSKNRKKILKKREKKEKEKRKTKKYKRTKHILGQFPFCNAQTSTTVTFNMRAFPSKFSYLNISLRNFFFFYPFGIVSKICCILFLLCGVFYPALYIPLNEQLFFSSLLAS